MKLKWKNFSLEKKVISKQDNMKEIMSFKSSKLINKANANTKNKILNKKSIEITKSLNNSFSSTSFDIDENIQKSKRNKDNTNIKTIQMNLAKNKFNDIKLISTTLSSDFYHPKKKEEIKKTFPTISNTRLKQKKFLSKLKLKKVNPNSQLNYNSNSILNKWRENIDKLFYKSLKKTKKDILQVLQKHKIKNIKKIIKTRNLCKTTPTLKEDTNSQNDDNLFNTQINYNYRPNNYINSEQYTESSLSSRSVNINKFEYNRYNNNPYSKGYDKNYRRKINYKEYMKEENILNINWKKKLGILNAEIKYGSGLLSNLNFQYNTIRDEINLITDGIHYYKISIFGNEDLLNAFNNKDLFSQININKTLEESCALLSLIPKIILKEYYVYCDKFISLPEPKKEYLFNKVITNETEWFNDNILLLYKIVNFIKASFAVYVQLVNQIEEEMLIARNEFEILKNIFEKCRYYIGNLTNFANNMLKDYYFDKNLIKKCKPILNEIKERLKDENKTIYDFNLYKNKKSEKKKEIKNKYYISSKNNKIKSKLNIMANNFNFQNDEFFQKVIRVKKALDNSEINNYTDAIRLKKLGLNVGKPMALIFSPLMTKMLKYIRKDYREKIIALRSTEKFFPSKEEDEDKQIEK